MAHIMAGMNAAGIQQKPSARPMRAGGATLQSGASTGSGGGAATGLPNDSVALGSGPTPDMANMNSLRRMAMQRVPSHQEIRFQQRMDAQGECVKESGKTGEEIKGMDRGEFARFQSNIGLCTDVKVMSQDMASEKAIQDRGGVSDELQQKINKLMMQ